MPLSWLKETIFVAVVKSYTLYSTSNVLIAVTKNVAIPSYNACSNCL